MVGTAVSDANCDADIPSSDDDLNTTNISSFTEASTSVISTTSPDNGVSAELQCRVGVAVAVTFLAGIYQVTSSTELNRTNFSHFQLVMAVKVMGVTWG